MWFWNELGKLILLEVRLTVVQMQLLYVMRLWHRGSASCDSCSLHSTCTELHTMHICTSWTGVLPWCDAACDNDACWSCHTAGIGSTCQISGWETTLLQGGAVNTQHAWLSPHCSFIEEDHYQNTPSHALNTHITLIIKTEEYTKQWFHYWNVKISLTILVLIMFQEGRKHKASTVSQTWDF